MTSVQPKNRRRKTHMICGIPKIWVLSNKRLKVVFYICYIVESEKGVLRPHDYCSGEINCDYLNILRRRRAAYRKMAIAVSCQMKILALSDRRTNDLIRWKKNYIPTLQNITKWIQFPICTNLLVSHWWIRFFTSFNFKNVLFCCTNLLRNERQTIHGYTIAYIRITLDTALVTAIFQSQHTSKTHIISWTSLSCNLSKMSDVSFSSR